MRVVLPFKLDGQTLVKQRGFPKSVADGSKDSVVIKVDGIPDVCNATGYFKLSWESGKVYDLTFDGDELVVDDYIVTLPAHANNKYIDYKFSFSLAILENGFERLTTHPVEIVVEKSNYSSTTTNTPDIPESQYSELASEVAELKKDVIDLKAGGGTGGGGTGSSSINDNVVSSLYTWSSQKISEELAKLSYEPIAVKGFTASPNKAEIGSTVSVTLNWQFNKTPSSVTVDGSAVTANASGSKTVSGVSATTSWSLVARDSDGASATKSVSVYFYNAVYYGAASEPSSYNSDFIKSLSGKEVVGSKLTNFTVNAGTDKYIYYCLPTRYGQCAFSVGGFSGGFDLVDTVSFTNNYNYTENYYVYRSDNASLGNTTVSVS